MPGWLLHFASRQRDMASSSFTRAGRSPSAPRRARGKKLSRPASDEGPPLGNVLGFMQLLWAVAHGLESISKRMRLTHGVTGPQRLVVRLIGHFGEPSPGELATVLHVHPSSLTGVLHRLERGRFIRRRKDPTDRRRAILSLTPNGMRLNARTGGTVESSVQQTLEGFPRATVEASREVLSALARALDAPPARSKRLRRAPR